MKTYFIISLTCVVVFSSCGEKSASKFQEVELALPAVKADRQTPPPADIALAEGNNSNYKAKMTDPAGNADVKQTVEDNTVKDTSKKIVKEGTIEFETADINLTRKKIIHSLKKYGGYVDEDNQTTNSDENRKEYNLKISIPAKYFDFLVDSVSAAADKIDSKSISITDVTTRFIDIKTRLNNKKILEGRYLDLLKKSSKVSDLLEIEDKLTDIRSDIESTQGQMNYLNKQIAYSSLDITFYTQHIDKVDKGTSIGDKFKTALADGWDFLQHLFFGIISIWPVILIAGVVYWLFRRWKRKSR